MTYARTLYTREVFPAARPSPLHGSQGTDRPGADEPALAQAPPAKVPGRGTGPTMWPAVLLAIAAFLGLLCFGGCRAQDVADVIGRLVPSVESSTIKAENAKVYITFDDASKATLPRGQIAAIDSIDIRTWLDSKKIAWRITPAAVTFADQPDWQAIDALPRASEPWLIVMGKSAKPIVSQALPADEAGLMAVLTKHLGK